MYGHPDIYNSQATFGLTGTADYEDTLLGVEWDDDDEYDEYGKFLGINLWSKARAKMRRNAVLRVLKKLDKFLMDDRIDKVEKYSRRLKKKLDALKKIVKNAKKKKTEAKAYLKGVMSNNPKLDAYLRYEQDHDLDALKGAVLGGQAGGYPGEAFPGGAIGGGALGAGIGAMLGGPIGAGIGAGLGAGYAQGGGGYAQGGGVGVPGTLSPSGAFVAGPPVRRSAYEDQYLTPAGGGYADIGGYYDTMPVPGMPMPSPSPYMGPTPQQAYQTAYQNAIARQTGRSDARVEAARAREAARLAQKRARRAMPRRGPFRRRVPPAVRTGPGLRRAPRRRIPAPVRRRVPPAVRTGPGMRRGPFRRRIPTPSFAHRQNPAIARRISASRNPRQRLAAARARGRRPFSREAMGAVDFDIARRDLFGLDPYITSEALGRSNTFSRSDLFDSVEAETALDEDDLFDIMEENAEFGFDDDDSYGGIFKRNLVHQIGRLRGQWQDAEASGDLTKMHRLEGRISEAEKRYTAAQAREMPEGDAPESAFERAYSRAAKKQGRKEKRAWRASGKAMHGVEMAVEEALFVTRGAIAPAREMASQHAEAVTQFEAEVQRQAAADDRAQRQASAAAAHQRQSAAGYAASHGGQPLYPRGSTLIFPGNA